MRTCLLLAWLLLAAGCAGPVANRDPVDETFPDVAGTSPAATPSCWWAMSRMRSSTSIAG